MSAPIFPTLIPSATDPLWFTVDKPCDDENELSELEEEYQSWIESISKKDDSIVPIGKTASETFDDEEDDEDDDGEEDEDEDESDTNDDELDTDMIDDHQEINMELGVLADT